MEWPVKGTLYPDVVESGGGTGAVNIKPHHNVLARISTRITNEVPEVNRVVLDVTSKPPSTIEWE